MSTLSFTRNEHPSLGVELELQLLDGDTLELSSSAPRILDALSADMEEKIKPELMECYIEINSDVCQSVSEVRADLCQKLDALQRVADAQNIKLLWSGTHPFSSWRDQKITSNERYGRLVEVMQDVARRLVTFGLHVHVGVDTGDKAVMVCDKMLRHLPLLLAVSTNSPFWNGRDTGLLSKRSVIMDGLPTAGLPSLMRNWSEYAWLINHLVQTGFIDSIRELWWDVRPHHRFGTVEVRICDIPANLDQVISIVSLVQCMVSTISNQIDEGSYQREYHPMIVQQNKWRAARFGASASLVDSEDYASTSVEELVKRLVELAAPAAVDLGCEEELRRVLDLPRETGAMQQLAIYRETGSLEEVVRQMLDKNDWRKSRAAKSA